ncbi:MAG TPA: hypothetical protein VMU15_06565 [Anaeromyxobacter sp.]|nr:hypothetical protein [Anaeromyxobacter sp.]
MTPPQDRLPGPFAARDRLSLAAILAGAFLPRALIGAAAEGLRAELWLTDQALGTLVTAFAAAFAAAPLAPARLAPRLRGPALLAAGLLLCGAGTAAAAGAGGFWSLVAARVASGAGAGLAASPRAREPGAGGWQPRPFAGAAGALALGLALGAAAAAWPGWRAASLAAGAALAALGVACHLAGGEPHPEQPPGRAAPRPDGRRSVAGRWPAAAGVALGAAGLSAMVSWLPAFLERARGVPRPAAGLELGATVLAAGLLGPALAATPVGAAGRAPSPAWRAAAGAAVAGLASAGALWHSSPTVYGPCLLVALLSASAATSAALSWLGGGAGPWPARPLLLAAVAGELSGAFGVGALADRAGFGQALLLLPAALLAAGGLLAAAAWAQGPPG